jgi:hypothetical protein
MELKPILDQSFRANPGYHLVVYDRLPAVERERLRPLAEEHDFYGVLAGGAQTKAVDPETALLVLTLQEAGPIPSYVRKKFGKRANQAVAELVLDDVLQIAVGGTFVSGAAAHAAIYEPAVARTTHSHRLAQLSYDALRYAQHLRNLHQEQLAQRLYQYNTVPFSAQWQQRLPDGDAVSAWLGLNGWTERAWRRTESNASPGWINWRHRQANQAALTYKLYVSPRPEVLPDVFRPIVKILAQWEVPTFKVGADAHGLLRPDKLVAYLSDFDRLAGVADALQSKMHDCPAQGVPFTAPIDAAGLLSWGMDPPDTAQMFTGEMRESWRFWIAQQLASALITARSTDVSVESWQYALDRLQLEKVDTERWIPDQSIWTV